MRRQHHYTAYCTFCQALRPESERVCFGGRGGSVRSAVQPAMGRRRLRGRPDDGQRAGQGQEAAERVHGLALDQKLDAADGGELA